MIVVVALLLLVTLAMWAAAIRALCLLLETSRKVARLEAEADRLEAREATLAWVVPPPPAGYEWAGEPPAHLRLVGERGPERQ